MASTTYKENIKFLIPRPITPVVKPPMYHSKFSKSVRKEYKSNRDCHRTMGCAEIPMKSPAQFLKKNTRKVLRPFVENTQSVPALTSASNVRQLCRNNGKSSLPPTITLEKPTRKNFVRMNIIDTVRTVPPLPKHYVQDTKNGHVIVPDKAGLKPIHVLKKNYGKTPKYLEQFNKDKEEQRRQQEERKKAIKPPLRVLSTEERNEILKGLKTNWAKLSKEFILLPIVTDTIKKIKRKNSLDKQLHELEKDIDLIQRNQALYVCRDTN